jgi:hypothetical protein
MTTPEPPTLTIRDARKALPGLCADFAEGNGDVVYLGARRKPEAALVPYHRYHALMGALRTLAADEARASVRADGLEPGPEIDPILNDWIRGRITAEQMRERVRAVYGDPATH